MPLPWFGAMMKQIINQRSLTGGMGWKPAQIGAAVSAGLASEYALANKNALANRELEAKAAEAEKQRLFAAQEAEKARIFGASEADKNRRIQKDAANNAAMGGYGQLAMQGLGLLTGKNGVLGDMFKSESSGPQRAVSNETQPQQSWNTGSSPSQPGMAAVDTRTSVPTQWTPSSPNAVAGNASLTGGGNNYLYPQEIATPNATSNLDVATASGGAGVKMIPESIQSVTTPKGAFSYPGFSFSPPDQAALYREWKDSSLSGAEKQRLYNQYSEAAYNRQYGAYKSAYDSAFGSWSNQPDYTTREQTVPAHAWGDPKYSNYASPEIYNYAVPDQGEYEYRPVDYEAFNYEAGGYQAPSYNNPGFESGSGTEDEGGGYGGGKIVCTELNRQGYLPLNVLLNDSECRKRYVDEETYKGYLTLFSPVVWLMKRSKLFTNIVRPFGVSVAHYMANKIDSQIPTNALGCILFHIGIPLCSLVGKLVRRQVWAY